MPFGCGELGRSVGLRIGVVEKRGGTWREARNGLGVGWRGDDEREWRKRRDSGLRERMGYMQIRSVISIMK
jgi:hypothetical protein